MKSKIIAKKMGNTNIRAGFVTVLKAKTDMLASTTKTILAAKILNVML